MTSEPIDGRQLMRELQPRQARASVALETALGIEEQQYPSLTEYIDHFRLSKRLEIYGPTPEIRFIESDQTAPAGEYRWGGTGDNFVMARSGAANFGNALGSANDFSFLEYNRSNTYMGLFASESNAWYLYLLAGAGATPGTNSAIFVQGHATAPSVDIRTGNAAGSLVSRFLVGGGASGVDIDVNLASLDMNGYELKGLASVRGEGTSDVYIRSFKAATDVTARRTRLQMLDPATDTEYTVAQAVPKAATPLWTTLAPNYTPTASEVDATHLTFTVDGTDQLIASFNKAGAMKTLVLGTLA